MLNINHHKYLYDNGVTEVGVVKAQHHR